MGKIRELKKRRENFFNRAAKVCEEMQKQYTKIGPHPVLKTQKVGDDKVKSLQIFQNLMRHRQCMLKPGVHFDSRKSSASSSHSGIPEQKWNSDTHVERRPYVPKYTHCIPTRVNELRKKYEHKHPDTLQRGWNSDTHHIDRGPYVPKNTNCIPTRVNELRNKHEHPNILQRGWRI